MAGREGGKNPHLRRSFWGPRWRGCAGLRGAVCRWGGEFFRACGGRCVARRRSQWGCGHRGAAVGAQHEAR